MIDVARIQARLSELGFDPGPVDGISGPRTTTAIRRFQASRALVADGIVGPLTEAALWPKIEAEPASLITADRIRAFAPSALPSLVAVIAGSPADFDAAGIVTPLRVQHFMAQIAVETAGLVAIEENLSYTARRLTKVWPARFPTIASAQPYARNPQALANKVYGGRLGNVAADDGWRYRGSGLMQTTGRYNFRMAGHEDDPESLRTPGPALRSALQYWTAHKCNAAADADDVDRVRKIINGGTNGLADAKAWLLKAKRVFV